MTSPNNQPKLTLFISAGEVSGDLHGAGLVRALHAQYRNISCFGMGHQAMKAAGVDIVTDISSHSAIGLFDSLRDSLKLASLIFKLATVIATRKPDAIVVIDCEGIHVPLLARIKHLNIPVIYYISPQIWWTRNKASQAAFTQKLAGLTDHIITIFQHEYAAYKDTDTQVHYVGHPLLSLAQPKQSKSDLYAALNLSPDYKLIGIFPGSRRQEIRDTYPTLLRAAQSVLTRIQHRTKVKRVVIISSKLYYDHIVKHTPDDVIIYTDHAYSIMPHLHASLTTSGTVTLEHACFGVPFVTAYKFSRLAAMAIRLIMLWRTVTVKWIALPNLVANQTIVPEYIQEKASVPALSQALYQLCDPHYTPDTNPYRLAQLAGFESVRKALSPPPKSKQGAIDAAARIILAVCADH